VIPSIASRDTWFTHGPIHRLGAVAGLVGGLVFLPIITVITGLSQLAGFVGGTSPVVGVIVHLFISALIGISYGLLFEHESPVTLAPFEGSGDEVIDCFS
jgi:hypothetical protein